MRTKAAALGSLLFLAAAGWAGVLSAENFTAGLDALLKKSPQEVGVSAVEVPSGKPVYAWHAQRPMLPASVLKLVTTAAALERLSPDYRFQTKVLVEGWQRGAAERLYLKGGGDPDLTDEKLWTIVRAVKRRGVDRIGTLVLDFSMYTSTEPRQGERAYQAGSSALPLNYNSIGVEACPSGAGASIRLLPPEAPAAVEGRVALSQSRRAGFSVSELAGPGEGQALIYRIGGSIGSGSGCVVQYRAVPDPAGYIGTVFKAYLIQAGIKIDRGPVAGVAGRGAKTIFVYASKALSQILEDLNHYSNNFTANQVTTALGGAADGGASLARGVGAMEQFLAGLGCAKEEYRLVDGSGLSHENRLSPRVITQVLVEMKRRGDVAPEFEKSLSVTGRNGTLKRRRFGINGLLLRGKTGTLDGVSTIAGYLTDQAGRQLAFAILQNRTASKAGALALDQKVVKALYYRSK